MGAFCTSSQQLVPKPTCSSDVSHELQAPPYQVFRLQESSVTPHQSEHRAHHRRRSLAELKTYENKIRSEGATEAVFGKYAKERSDCGSYRDSGGLGNFGPGEMQKQFEEGCRSTQVGGMSGPVLSDSGYHLIFRLA